MAQGGDADMESISINVDLESWKLDYEKDRVLATAHKFSPEWTECFNAFWGRYDDLVKRQRTSSVKRIWWQDELEGKRKFWLDCRDDAYYEIQPYNWRLCPLAVHHDRVFDQETQDRWLCWKSARENWERFRQTYDGDPIVKDGQRFRASLSAPQKSSYQVLRQWWNSQYHDPEFMSAFKTFLEEESNSPVTSEHNGLFGQYIKCKAHESLYHSYCFRLFQSEFYPAHWEPFESTSVLQYLQNNRVSAASHAVTQRMSYAVLHPKTDLKAASFDPVYPQVVLTPDVGFEKIGVKGSPYYLWDVSKSKTVKVHELPDCPQYVCVSHTWGRWKTRTSTEILGVPWEVPENTRFDVRDLPKQLANLGITFIWLDLFCINQVDKQERDDEVARQATIFRGASNVIAWITDVTSWEPTRVALDWLGIGFLRTTQWLDDVEPLDQKRASLTTAASEKTGLTIVRGSNLPERFDLLEKKMPELVSNNIFAFEEPCYWFSSLWTLQEAVLCPTIKLVTKDWEELTDRQGCIITLVTFLQLIHQASRACRLIRTPQRKIPFYDPENYDAAFEALSNAEQEGQFLKWPNGPRQLHYLKSMTRMDNLLTTLSPAAVLMNANLRRCSGRRAEAIMSAIGVQDWYRGPSADKDILLDSYPLTFVREAAQKSGAMFFEPSTGVVKDHLTFKETLSSKANIGSMMPFTKKKGWFSEAVAVPEWKAWDLTDHEAVRTWEIRKDASVRIKTAGIMACYPPPSHSNESSLDVEAVITTSMARPNQENPNKPKDEQSQQEPHLPDVNTSYKLNGGGSGVRLEGTFRTQLKDIVTEKDRVYAVALYHDQRNQHGIILLGPRTRRWELGKQYLVKIGAYSAAVKDMLRSEGVNWIVL